MNETQTTRSNEVGRVSETIEVVIYTDPLCCWSWAFQPQLEALQQHFGDSAIWKYRMGGLLPLWNNFHDEVNSVTRPAQMGPVWLHAAQIAGKPVQHQLWITDPPSSSYPACVAVKSAQLQSDAFGESYLHLLREACFEQGLNVAKETVLMETAAFLGKTDAAFDLTKFKEDFANGNAIEAFRRDLEFVRFYGINRFPTLIIKGQGQKTIMLSGYRRHEDVLEAINQSF